MCRWQNHLQGHFDMQKIPCFMVKYFHFSRALSPYWKLRRKGLWQDPESDRTWGKKLQILFEGLAQGLCELCQPLLISRKFFLSSLRFGCQIITMFSRVFLSWHIFPYPVSLPEQSQWQPKQRGLRSKSGGNFEPSPWLSPKNPKKNENIHLTGLLPFSCFKKTYYCSVTDITSSKKYFCLSAVHDGIFFANLCSEIEISKAHTKF